MKSRCCRRSVAASRSRVCRSPTAHASLQREPIDSAPLLAHIKEGEDGAVCLFEGMVRNHTRHRQTLYLEYESYPAMAIAGMEKLALEALQRFPVRDVRIAHRVGRLEIGETSISSWSPAPIAPPPSMPAAGSSIRSRKACRYGKRNSLKTAPVGPTVNHFPRIELRSASAHWVHAAPATSESWPSVFAYNDVRMMSRLAFMLLAVLSDFCCWRPPLRRRRQAEPGHPSGASSTAAGPPPVTAPGETLAHDYR